MMSSPVRFFSLEESELLEREDNTVADSTKIQEVAKEILGGLCGFGLAYGYAPDMKKLSKILANFKKFKRIETLDAVKVLGIFAGVSKDSAIKGGQVIPNLVALLQIKIFQMEKGEPTIVLVEEVVLTLLKLADSNRKNKNQFIRDCHFYLILKALNFIYVKNEEKLGQSILRRLDQSILRRLDSNRKELRISAKTLIKISALIWDCDKKAIAGRFSIKQIVPINSCAQASWYMLFMVYKHNETSWDLLEQFGRLFPEDMDSSSKSPKPSRPECLVIQRIIDVLKWENLNFSYRKFSPGQWKGIKTLESRIEQFLIMLVTTSWKVRHVFNLFMCTNPKFPMHQLPALQQLMASCEASGVPHVVYADSSKESAPAPAPAAKSHKLLSLDDLVSDLLISKNGQQKKPNIVVYNGYLEKLFRYYEMKEGKRTTYTKYNLVDVTDIKLVEQMQKAVGYPCFCPSASEGARFTRPKVMILMSCFSSVFGKKLVENGVVPCVVCFSTLVADRGGNEYMKRLIQKLDGLSEEDLDDLDKLEKIICQVNKAFGTRLQNFHPRVKESIGVVETYTYLNHITSLVKQYSTQEKGNCLEALREYVFMLCGKDPAIIKAHKDAIVNAIDDKEIAEALFPND